jgi:hypothetical protein
MAFWRHRLPFGDRRPGCASSMETMGPPHTRSHSTAHDPDPMIQTGTLVRILPLVLVCLACVAVAHAAQQPGPVKAPQLKVFLDCGNCFEDYMRSEITFVDYVRDRLEAEIHVLITSAETGSGGREYTLAFIGNGRFAGVNHTLKTVTIQSDPQDVIRRQIATTLRIGLLNYIANAGVPSQLAVTVRLGSEEQRPAVAGDRWNNWVFSLRGSADFAGEESSRQRELGLEFSADRITPEWKVTFGVEIDHEREEFDLDEDEPVEVERRQRDFESLVVKGLGEHWSVGTQGSVESSTFDNVKLGITMAPAIEYNFFPYSMYTRRQLRANYAVGLRHFQYYEVTLYGETSETRPQHEISLTLDQRERWGTLQARTEFSQYLHDLALTRFEIEGEISVRLTRGLSVQTQVNASRIRDQIGLPARGATDEEILLRLRQLQSGYEYGVGFSLTYTFGSIFSSVVNPRFGQ